MSRAWSLIWKRAYLAIYMYNYIRLCVYYATLNNYSINKKISLFERFCYSTKIDFITFKLEKDASLLSLDNFLYIY